FHVAVDLLPLRGRQVVVEEDLLLDGFHPLSPRCRRSSDDGVRVIDTEGPARVTRSRTFIGTSRASRTVFISAGRGGNAGPALPALNRPPRCRDRPEPVGPGPGAIGSSPWRRTCVRSGAAGR